MRRRIRLTGRRQISKNCVNVSLISVGQKRFITLSVADQDALKGLPKTAKVKLKLNESKQVEVLDFGYLGTPSASVELKQSHFVAPSCELRIVGSEGKTGILLASTDTWTLADDKSSDNQQGILYFKPAATAPRVWKLELRDGEHPIIYIDKRIPNAKHWANSDPVFVGAVLPTVINSVFKYIFGRELDKSIPWVADWIAWSESLLPGDEAPLLNEEEQDDWTERLIENFAQKHMLAEKIVNIFQKAQHHVKA